MKKIFSTILTTFLFWGTSFTQGSVNETQIQKVMTLSEEGQTDRALFIIDSLKSQLKVKDQNYVGLLMLSAELNEKNYTWEEAIIDYEEVIALVPDLENDILMKIARIKRLLGDFEGAIVAYKRIIKIDPGNSFVNSNMVSALNDAGEYKEAIRILDSKSKKTDQDYYNYAIAHYQTNNPDSAKKYVNKYLETDKGQRDFAGYFTAAKIYFSLGDIKSSCTFIEKANEIVISGNSEEQIRKQTPKVQNYYFAKEKLKEIDEIKKLKSKYCE